MLRKVFAADMMQVRQGKITPLRYFCVSPIKILKAYFTMTQNVTLPAAIAVHQLSKTVVDSSGELQILQDINS